MDAVDEEGRHKEGDREDHAQGEDLEGEVVFGGRLFAETEYGKHRTQRLKSFQAELGRVHCHRWNPKASVGKLEELLIFFQSEPENRLGYNDVMMYHITFDTEQVQVKLLKTMVKVLGETL